MKSTARTKKFAAMLIALAMLIATAFACGFGFTSKSASAATASDAKVSTSGLGKSVNAVTTDYLDLTELKSASVFDSNWLETQKANADYVEVNNTSLEYHNSSNFQSIVKSYTMNLKMDSSVTADVDIFTAGISNGFEVENIEEYTKKFSHFYYLFNSWIKRYTLALPEFSDNFSLYLQHLNTNYVNTLARLFNGTISYDTFFNTYGTHVIMKGIYGGSFNLFYQVASNSIDVGNKSYKALKDSVQAGIKNVVEGSSSMGFSMESLFNCFEEEYLENVYLTARGGGTFTGYSFEDFNSEYKSWAKSVEQMPVLVAMSSEGFIPIWEFLPSKYSAYKTTMRNEFINYAKSRNSDIVDYYKYLDLKNLDDTVSIQFDMREEEYKITDSGPMNQQYDIIESLPTRADGYGNSWGFGYDLMVSAGYKYMTVSVDLDRKEKDDGYQEFYLYNNLNNNYDDGQIRHEQREYYKGIAKKTYGRMNVTFERVELDSLNSSLNYFKEVGKNTNRFKPIVIRYGATGVGEDTWYNKNAVITLTFSRS